MGSRVYGWCVMGIEALNSAARAAGFAMAASEEPYAEVEVEVKPAETQSRPGEAVPRSEAAGIAPRVGEWVRGMLGLFGRRAPASSA
jgi:hypothetical protein